MSVMARVSPVSIVDAFEFVTVDSGAKMYMGKIPMDQSKGVDLASLLKEYNKTEGKKNGGLKKQAPKVEVKVHDDSTVDLSKLVGNLKIATDNSNQKKGAVSGSSDKKNLPVKGFDVVAPAPKIQEKRVEPKPAVVENKSKTVVQPPVKLVEKQVEKHVAPPVKQKASEQVVKDDGKKTVSVPASAAPSQNSRKSKEAKESPVVASKPKKGSSDKSGKGEMSDYDRQLAKIMGFNPVKR